MIKRIIAILGCCLCCFMPVQSWAQDQSIGQLWRIIDKEKQEELNENEETDRVRVQREDWINARPKIELFKKELIQVKKDMRADLRIRKPDQEGDIYLAPDTPESFFPIKEEGIYRISDGPEKVGGFKLLIVKGSLVCDWLYGVLRVDLAGFSVDISGTRVVLMVDESGDQAVIFLKEGSISFPAFPEFQVNASEAIALKRAQAPVKFDLSNNQVEQLEQFMEFNVEDVWSKVKPWWQKPLFYVPAAAAAVTLSGILLFGDKDEDSSRNGTVIITIPF